MPDYVYVLYETYRDDNNYPAYRYDMEIAYATEELANAEAQLRNEHYNQALEREYKKDLAVWAQEYAEWNALVDAGLRSADSHPPYKPSIRREKIWFVLEQDLLTDGGGSEPLMTLGDINQGLSR